MTNQVTKTTVNPKSITDDVLNRVKEMKDKDGFLLPKGYSAKNALKSAYLVLQGVKDRNKRPALEVCTKPSIANTLLNMVIQGLSPAKTQCYFIVYGNELQMQRSYFGTVAVLKRLDSVKNITAQVVHEGDKFEIGSDENFQTVVKEFQPSIENQDKEIAYAFARIFKNDGTYVDTIMTKKEIDQSWAQTRQKNNKVQQNFSQEMAKRTVLNRAAKMFINTSDDSDLLTGAINDTTSNEYDDERRDVTPVEDEKQSTDELLEGFNKSQEAKAKGVSNNGNSNENKEEASEEVADGQTELFNEGTIKPADEADS